MRMQIDFSGAKCKAPARGAESSLRYPEHLSVKRAGGVHDDHRVHHGFQELAFHGLVV